MNLRRFFSALLLSGLFISSPQLRAQFTWTADEDNNVADDLNWTPVSTFLGTGTEDVVFDNTAASFTPHVPSAGTAVHNITFSWSDALPAPRPAYTFSSDPGATLTLNGNLSAYNLSGSDGNVTFDSNLNILLSDAPHFVDIGSGITITVDGIISHTVSGASLLKNGGGTLALNSGYSTFAGGVSLDAGTLQIGSSSTYDTDLRRIIRGPVGTGTLTLHGGTTLQTPGAEDTFTLHNDIALPDSSSPATVRLGEYDSLVLAGQISGPGAIAVREDVLNTGSLALSGNNNTWTGGLTVYDDAQVYVQNSAALGTGPLAFASDSDGVVFFQSSASIGGLSGGHYTSSTARSLIKLNQDVALTINQGNSQYNGAIAGYTSGGFFDGGLIKNGAGSLALTGPGTYYGPTVINNGTLVADAITGNLHQLGYGPVSIETGATLALKNTTLFNSTVTVNSGGRLIGSGSLGAGFSYPTSTTVQSGGKIAPGFSGSAAIGQLAFDHLVMQGGSIYEWKLLNPTGTAGVGWDLASISDYTSTLHIDSTSGSPLTLKLISLDSAGNPGTTLGFVVNQTYTWTILSGGPATIMFGAGTTFDPTVFTIDNSLFTTNISSGTFSLSKNTLANTIELNFTPVPEPSTYALMALGLGFVIVTVRCRRV